MKPRASTSLPALAVLRAACLALCLILPAAALPSPAQEGKGEAPGKEAPEKPSKKGEKKPADKKPAEKKKTGQGKLDFAATAQEMRKRAGAR
jgi:hypothetical protein